LVAPEMQLLNETSASAWVNYIRDGVNVGVGIQNFVPALNLNGRDLQRDWAYEMSLAPNTSELVKYIALRLLYDLPSAALSNEIVTAVNKIVIPPLAANGSNLAAVNAAKRNRVNAVLLLTMASPEYLVQK
jgi:hypothetical protein